MTENANRRNQVAWFRIGAEVVAIIASILIAFAIDAWWDGSKERREERDSLEALAEELSDSQAELDFDLSAKRTNVEIIDLLTAHLNGEMDSLKPDTVVIILGRLRWQQMFTPPQAVLNEMISSGRMNLIRSSALRRSLLEYSQWLEKTQINEAQERAFLDNRFSPFLSEYSHYPLPSSDTSILSETREAAGLRILSAAYLLNRESPGLPSQTEVFGNLLIERKEYLSLVLGRYGTIQTLIDTLQAQIEQELGG